jgi:hypothetical protein
MSDLKPCCDNCAEKTKKRRIRILAIIFVSVAAIGGAAYLWYCVRNKKPIVSINE